MPHIDKETTTVEYPIPKSGVNLYKNQTELQATEAKAIQNMVWRGGLIKRYGGVLINTAEVTASKRVLGLHRYYYDNTSTTLAMAGTNLAYDTGSNTWTTLHTFATTGQKTTMNTWQVSDREYIANGTDNAIRLKGIDAVGTGTSIASQSITLTIKYADIVDWVASPISQTQIEITVNNTIYLFKQVDPSGSPTPPDWRKITDDATTATSIAAAIDDNAYLVATAVGDKVTITPQATTDYMTRIRILHVDVVSTVTTTTVLPTTYTGIVMSDRFLCPRKVIQFLPYQDRLLSIDNNDRGYLRWSGSLNDQIWEPLGSAGGDVHPDTQLYGMIVHALSNVAVGYDAAVLIAGAKGMYIFKGTILDTSSTSADYAILPLAITSGCSAAKTLTWTPIGSFWLGIDREVYMLPFHTIAPIPVGKKITSTGVEMGLESLPSAQLENACGVYHDGYYKLCFAGVNSSQNNIQYWLDITRMEKDDDGHFGPWFGPMIGQNIDIFANKNGPGDLGQLLAGFGDSSTERGYVFEANAPGVRTDIEINKSTLPIECELKTFFNPIGELAFRKDVHEIEFELKNTGGTVTIAYKDITGTVVAGVEGSIDLNLGSFTWGDGTRWGEKFWANTGPVRRVVEVSPAISPRRLQLVITHSETNHDFQLYGMRVNAVEQKKSFD